MTFETLYRSWDSKLGVMARQFYIPGNSPDDLYQELALVLWNCFNSYDSSKGNQFSTLFYTSARNKLIAMLAKAQRIKRTPPALASMEEAEETLMVDVYEDVEYELELTNYIRDKQVIRTIRYITRGGDPNIIPRPVLQKVRYFVGQYYSERSKNDSS